MTTFRARLCLAAALLGAVATGSAVLAQKGGDPSGVWLTETGDSKVRLARCGAGFCGTIVSTSGKGLDQNNPDPALRTRSVVGVQIVNATRATADGFEGSLYNPKDGKTYSGSLKLTGPSTIEVAGCVLSVFCKRQTWKRVN
ncbi:DUF2147 domain-containing protein [Methylobacterium soli]|uniref:DUF2147 domain-containing protein n=1 Tax=Methylobacterium soli TaxID=553447 RepID=A0A6L3T8L4_9HYPH|nr:DUF2147 domain-containing protein [Methylobacterium soli]KAB1081642.1 DUF2147 domain-containing protein [Methylobacterium soli]GJE41048.1 hypothetical protein AEGHOMDF_0208 [Methylobacterium soli]